MDGILVINKPAGMTSHDVINVLRRRYKQKKFGHTGTLDPQASGVLVVLAGRAVKLLQFLEDTDKQYQSSIALGTRYDTDDIWGTPLETKEIDTNFDFAALLQEFQGPLHQRVPDTSAKKVNGKKLMDYQRQGLDVPEVYADVEVYDIHPLDEKTLSFQVDCSSGTYIRSICRDLALKSGNLGAMSRLVRTKASGFSLEQAEELDAPQHTLYPMDRVLNLPKVEYQPIQDIFNGKHVRLSIPEDRVLIVQEGEPVAVYERDHENVFACKRGLWA